MKLPLEFVSKMQKLLPPEEYELFMSSYNMPVYSGLRVNTLKISVTEFWHMSPFALRPVPWAPSGFYFEREERPAKHPYYHAGLYYLQEPSAMAPAAILDPQPGEKVLDLCAAPGGKTTQLAAAMQGEGLLVANDLGSDRVKVLVKNIELAGIRNAIVANETPERLAKHFPQFFDRVLVDAPCSGEGMFRKDPGVLGAWTAQSHTSYAHMQHQILQAAAEMIRPGGRLVYSTCTFTPEENEEIVLKFIKENREFTLVDIPKEHGFAAGFTKEGENVSAVARLWPHRLQGEGHFLALLERTAETAQVPLKKGQFHKICLDTYQQFMQKHLPNVEFEGNFINYGEHLYIQPGGLPSLQGLKIVRPGLYLGQLKKNRFEPSHALAMSLKANESADLLDFAADDPEIIRYLKAETLSSVEGGKGWVLVSVDGYPVGWGKRTPEGLKNYYPIAWRWVD